MSSSWPALNHVQLRALAKFLNTMRQDWDVPGIEHQLVIARDRGSAPAVAIAAIKAAASAHNRTPGVIPLDGEHWRAPVPGHTSSPRAVPASELCQVCGLPEPRCQLLAQALPKDGHAFEPVGTPALDLQTGELLDVDHTAHREQLRQIVAETADALAVPQ